MNEGLSLLQSETDWKTYQNAYMEQESIGKIIWVAEPARFPCLASSVFVGPRVFTCFVYVNDAKKLLSVSGATVDTLEESTSVMVVPKQDEFNREIQAHCATLVEILVKTGIIKEKPYHDWYLKTLARADQKNEDDLRAAREKHDAT